MMRLAAWPAALALLCVLKGGCAPVPSHPARPPAAATPLPFLDVAEASGIRFRHDTGGSGRHYMPETMGSGCAFLDYNGDGRPDVLLLQGAPLPGRTAYPAQGSRLFENDGGGRFHEVPGAAGLNDTGYGMGCCAADIDNDGDLDVLVTRFGGISLYRNDGGHFTNVTARAGLNLSGWAASAAFGDFDRDGFVDLFVTRYVQYDPLTSAGCAAPDGSPGYCPPEVFPPTRDVLFRNRGNGTFQDVTASSGVGAVLTRGLGVEFVDYDHDGWPDLFVACDQSPNVLWHNLRSGRFANVASELGVATDDAGQIQNGMGVDFADPDHDGDLDGFVTNFSGQANSFFLNAGKDFRYRSNESGLGLPSVSLLGFGCSFLDYDGDGWEDLFVANGHVNDRIAASVPGVGYAEPGSLYRNDRTGHFAEVAPVTGQSLWLPRVRRGSAVADYDEDGAPDLLVSSCGDRAELFHNESRPGSHWLTVRLEGTRSNRSAIGARLRLTAGGTTQTREVRAGSSYLSQSDLGQTFGLGAADRVERLSIEWPSGRRTELRDLAGGRVLKLREPGTPAGH